MQQETTKAGNEQFIASFLQAKVQTVTVETDQPSTKVAVAVESAVGEPAEPVQVPETNADLPQTANDLQSDGLIGLLYRF